MSVLCCPVCGEKLEREAGAYRCAAGHSYDIARDGYVNLLTANMAHSKTPGDSADMVAARADFLSKGYYEPLRGALALAAAELTQGAEAPVYLDAGCGEGYYTAGICEELGRGGRRPSAAGFDLSKYALRRAAKKLPEAEFAVASLFHMPVGERCADLITDIFAPVCPAEFARVLKDDGTLMLAVPGQRHLWGLKELLYDEPYLNDGEEPEHKGFSLLRKAEVRENILLENQTDIMALFSMTPYFWKTSKEGSGRLQQVERLESPIEFDIYIFKKD